MSEVGGRAGDCRRILEVRPLAQGRPAGQLQLLVRFEDAGTHESPGAGALVLQAAGRDALGLLGEIRRAILEQRIGEAPEEELTLESATVARSALAGGIDGRVLDVERKRWSRRRLSRRSSRRREVQAGKSRRRADEGAIEILAGGPGSRRQGARGFHLLCVGR